MGPLRTLVVWCPDWPVVAAGYEASVPVALVAANRVVACSEAARDQGVEAGLRRREAQGRCPGLVVEGPDPAREVRAFEPVVAAVETFTPEVEVVRPGMTAFTTRGPSRYFGGDQALAAQVEVAVDAVLMPLGGPRCRVGVADGRFAAELAAQVSGSGSVAITVVPPRTSAAFLAPLPVAALDRPALADLLTRLGLTTLGHLAALPAATVLARFGSEGAEAHRLARGLDERPLAARTPPPDLAVTAELDPPAERVDMAAFTAKTLADELHRRLSSLGLACTRIAIEAETEHGEHQVRLWRHDGALTAGAIAERVRWQLDGWLGTGVVTAGLTLLRLTPDEVKPDHGRQLGFWGASPAADDRAARALARIQGLLGPEAVVTAVVGGGRDPAGQVRLVPWGDPREPARPGRPDRGARAPISCRERDALATSTRQLTPGPPRAARRTMGAAADETPPWPGHLPFPAPAVVHSRPVAAELRDSEDRLVAVSGRGELSSAPVSLVMEGRSHLVTAWAGPWPAEERWWDSDTFRRRARIQLCLEDRTAHLVVLEGAKWWVEATYD
ncbi:MAG TPA: DNA polymerase Y family protein [Acidimicrobiales bacterium]